MNIPVQNLKGSANNRGSAPPSIAQWLNGQRLENLVAQRTQELEQAVQRLMARQAELESHKNHDSQTGLATMTLLRDRFECAVATAERNQIPFALLVIQLDCFKAINDIHGHAAGNAVLVEVAYRLRAVLRSCDTVARLGDDEFAVILDRLDSPDHQVKYVSQKVLTAITAEIRLQPSVAVFVGASIGHAIYVRDGRELDSMLRLADRSMNAYRESLHASTRQAANVLTFGGLATSGL